MQLAPLIAGVEGEADRELAGEGERLEYVLAARPQRIEAGSSMEIRAGEARLEARGEAPLLQLADLHALRDARLPEILSALAGPLAVSLTVPTAVGRWGERELPAALFPLRLHANGELVSEEGTPSFRGRTDLASAAGRLTARGAVSLGAALSADLGWQWPETSVETLRPLLDELGARPWPAGLRGRLAASGRFAGPLSPPLC